MSTSVSQGLADGPDGGQRWHWTDQFIPHADPTPSEESVSAEGWLEGYESACAEIIKSYPIDAQAQALAAALADESNADGISLMDVVAQLVGRY